MATETVNDIVKTMKGKAAQTNALMFDVLSLLHAALDIVELLPDNERDSNGLTSPISRLIDMLDISQEKTAAAIKALDV